jgi:histidinol-phosphate aminotransferase
VDFADDPETLTAIPLVQTGRVAVLRTFAKVHGLAGLRVGYLIAAPEMVDALRKVRAPFSVGSLAQAGAVAATRDPLHRAAVREHTLDGRARITQVLSDAGYDPVAGQSSRRPHQGCTRRDRDDQRARPGPG